MPGQCEAGRVKMGVSIDRNQPRGSVSVSISVFYDSGKQYVS